MKNYRYLTAPSIGALETELNEVAKKGWRPLNTIVIDRITETSWEYIQLVERESKQSTG